MVNKIKTTAGTVKKQILFATQPSMTVSAVMSAAGAIAVGNRKIQKAGTPVTGDLTARICLLYTSISLKSRLWIRYNLPAGKTGWRNWLQGWQTWNWRSWD